MDTEDFLHSLCPDEISWLTFMGESNLLKKNNFTTREKMGMQSHCYLNGV